MVFSSELFLFAFLPVTLIVYYIIPSRFIQVKNGWLLIMSMLFYAWGEPKNVLLMIVSILMNYIFGLLLEKYDKKNVRQFVLFLSVLFNLGMLFFFKYLGFFTNYRFQVALPIGISFFTFQIMSYTIDVYRRNVPVQTNVFKLGLYISLFPQLIAGPIVRYIDVAEQIDKRSYDISKIFFGVSRFSIGLAKKVVISNTVAALVDQIFELDPTLIASSTAWLGAVAYALQIYFDFSGYSDMAIGIGHMLGFDFIENFDYPYISGTVQEFWRRWHISLSSWFKDYLYIPLGGNRKGKVRTYVNLLIVFAATGFWHGASLNFLIWGLFHGLFLVIERIGFSKLLSKIPKFIGRIYTLLVVLVGWVLFRAENMTVAWQYICSMFNFARWGWVQAVSQLSGMTIIILLIGIVFSTPILPKLSKAIVSKQGGVMADTVIRGIGAALLLFVSILCLAGSGYNPFIYFRF